MDNIDTTQTVTEGTREHTLDSNVTDILDVKKN